MSHNWHLTYLRLLKIKDLFLKTTEMSKFKTFNIVALNVSPNHKSYLLLLYVYIYQVIFNKVFKKISILKV